MKTIPLLTKDDIEVKVKQVTEKGAVALLYKTARVDMAILDEVFRKRIGRTIIKKSGQLYAVWKKMKRTFVWKWDCGIESERTTTTSF